MRRGLHQRDMSDVWLKGGIGVFVTLFTLLCFYPFFYIVINSLSSAKAVRSGVFLYPKEWDLSSYVNFFKRNDIGQAFFISVARTVSGTLITLLCSSLLGYVFSQRKMLFRAFFYRLVICTMYISAGLIPWYLTMRMYNLRDSFLLYILPGAVSAYYMVLLKTYFEQLPASLEESASLEGAGVFTIFFRIVLPLSTPILATIAVYAAVGQWNAWQDAYFLVNNKNLRPVQLMLYNYLNEAERIASAMRSGAQAGENMRDAISPETVRMTIIVITVFPILTVYPMVQKYFTKGIMIGAIKG